MARSAKQARKQVVVDDRSPLQEGALALGGLIARNPILVGGSTAFLVALFYVSANALWYQPYAHKGAFFSTREAVEFPDMKENAPETTIKIERPQAEVVRPQGDPRIEQVQSILKDLAFYDGTVDGLNGPATRIAIQAYQKKVGLAATGEIDPSLLEQLGAADTTAGIAPKPTPRVQATPAPTPAPRVEAAPLPARTEPTDEAGVSARIMKIQAGLKAFGNDGIEIDGVPGGRTKAAIREFQSLFGLPQTGEPDPAVYVKMREIGLTN